MTQAVQSEISEPAFEQEIRIAAVMYGGVSLAIYINGITQELYHLVRATAVDANDRLLPTNILGGTERVYRKLASIARLGAPNVCDGTVRTRFVIDIASGTSAGGINAIFLGKALANGSTLDQVANLWLDKGDLKDLLNDGKGIDGFRFVDGAPSSLLSSKGMYNKLLDAFTAMDDSNREPHPLQGEMDVFVTATDIHGLELPIALSDMQVVERRHKNVFRLRFETNAGRVIQNDFEPKLNGFLAFTARATSSFPFAFEPMRLEDIDTILSTRKGTAELSKSNELARFFPHYVANDSAADYRRVAFGDGGYLDNKPFSYAIDALSQRTSDLPMRRKLVYIEPSPEMRIRNRSDERPNFLENSLAAVLTLHQYETIREDLQRVLERNRLIERVDLVISKVEQDVATWKEQRNQHALTNPTDAVVKAGRELEDYAERTVADECRDRGLAYAGYHRLKLRAVTDDLALSVTHAAELMEDSDEFRAIRFLLGEWRQQMYGRDDTQSTRFLLEFDLSYRRRRLRFLLNKVDQFYREPLSLAAGASVDALRSELRLVKKELSKISKLLFELYRSYQLRGRDNPAYALVMALGIDPKWLRELLGMSAEDCARGTASYFAEYRAQLNDLADHVRRAYRKVTEPAAEQLARCLAPRDANPNTAREAVVGKLREYFDDYEYYDQITFPIFYETMIGEAEPADVIRISPVDAPSIMNEADNAEKRRKLAGTALFNFGAFLDRLWRNNDMLWGRLDGAERLINSILPRHSPEAAQLVREAHLAIVREELRPAEQAALRQIIVRALLEMPLPKPGAGAKAGKRNSRDEQRSVSDNVKKVRQLLETHVGAPVDPKVQALLTACMTDEDVYRYLQTSYEVDREFSPNYALPVLGRAAEIIGRMLEEVAKQTRSDGTRTVLLRPAAWLAQFGSIFWGLVQVAVPGGFGNQLFRHWLKILYAFEVLLLLGSTLAVSAPTQQLAVIAILLTVALQLSVTVLTAVTTRKHWVLDLIVASIVIVTVGLAIYGGWNVYEELPRLSAWFSSRISQFLTTPVAGIAGPR